MHEAWNGCHPRATRTKGAEGSAEMEDFGGAKGVEEEVGSRSSDLGSFRLGRKGVLGPGHADRSTDVHNSLEATQRESPWI